MEHNQFLNAWPGIFLFDLLRYVIPASLAYILFWVIGKNRWQHLIIQNILPKNRQLWTEFKYSMSTVFIFSVVGFGIYIAAINGLTLIYDSIDTHGWGYMIISFLLMILLHDFYFYVTHRLMHHPLLYKHIHRVHHQSTNPSPWAAYSFHPWEALVQALVLPILVVIMPVHALTIFLFTLYMIIRNVLGHLGFEIFPKGFTKSSWLNWHTTSTHHNMHHQFFNCNYGLYFSWWDNIFKTTHKNYDKAFEKVKSRKKVTFLKRAFSILILISFLNSSSLVAQSITGEWISYHDETGLPLSSISIQEMSGTIKGKVLKIFLQPDQGENPLCTKCESQNKNKPVLEMDILWSFKKINDTWTGGKILDPSTGLTYTSKMWIGDNGKLWVRGYAGPFNLFYKTEQWNRVSKETLSTPEGTWEVQDENSQRTKSIVQISLVSNEYRGRVIKIIPGPYEGEDPLCYSCGGSLHDQKIVGMTILSDFKKLNDKWVNGKVLDPGNGKTYAAEMWLLDENTLLLRGYWGPFFRSERWKRLDNQNTQLINSTK